MCSQAGTRGVDESEQVSVTDTLVRTNNDVRKARD